jgi:hypothetical protein
MPSAIRDFASYAAVLWQEWKVLLTGGSIMAAAALHGFVIGKPVPANVNWLIVGLTLILAAFLSWRRTVMTAEQWRQDLVLKAIWDAIHTHIRLYREINAENPAESRYPLKAWPKFGELWREAHASLFAESVAFERTRELMRGAWADLGWAEKQEIFKLTERATMVSLLSALDEVDYFLKSKVRVLGT